MATPTSQSVITRFRFSPECALVGMAITLLLLPWLFVSSPDYRANTLAAFGLGSVCLAWLMPEVGKAAADLHVKVTGVWLILIYLASFAGGLRQGETIAQALMLMGLGFVGVTGIGILTLILLQPKWRRPTLLTFFSLTAALVVASLLGFFVFTAWHLEVSQGSPHMDPRRLALIWPTRILAGELGNQFWAHTNTAAFLFAIAWAVTVELLSHRPRFAAAGWALAVLLGTAVFLTASRSAWLMIILVLPVLLTLRPRKFCVKVFASLALCLGLGFLGMSHTIGRLSEPAPEGGGPVVQENPGAVHVSGLVERGSAGRIDYYKHLWAELQDERLFGHGHSVARTPLAHLLHEHSSYLATLRSGGTVALAWHLLIIGHALSAAVGLARRGCRWPLVLGITVFSGLLFDRSTVFRLTGFDEFPVHWLAVWIPLLLSYRERSRLVS